MVSILTRPWGRVQRGRRFGKTTAASAVSILTRPWGRVQCDAVRDVVRYARFQSSPARGGGCNRMSHPYTIAARMFQSSPARGSGCNLWNDLGAFAARVLFQSSPARGGGCNAATSASVTRGSRFQSSPARGGGCNAAWRTRGSGSPNASVPVVKVCRAALWAANGWAFAYGHKVCSVTPLGGLPTCTE